jgi:hypothetical protein
MFSQGTLTRSLIMKLISNVSMNNKSKGFAVFIILIMAISSLTIIFATIPTVLAQSGTNISGIITQDTIWKKTNSPYSLTGPVAVNQGVTLTIEAGTTVNLNGYYVQVNGTLLAIGSSTNQINIKGPGDVRGGIIITAISNGWNQQTGSGCIIENAIISASVIAQNSVKIDHNTITASVTGHDFSIITNNNITGGTVGIFDSSIFSNNTITSATGLGSLLFGGTVLVSVGSGFSVNTSPIISSNVIKGSHDNGGHGSEGIQVSDYASITGNTIDGCKTGINVESTGTALIDKNLIINNQDGIDILGTCNIQENLLTKNYNAITISHSEATIFNNNIYANNFNLVSGVSYNINAQNNWWGTTDQQAINQTIHDSKNDFNLGTVNFVPFLTEANKHAPNPNTSTLNPSSSLTPTITPSPTTPEFPSAIAFTIFIVILTMVILSHQKRLKL